MASVIARAAGLPDVPPTFSDVPAGYVHAGAIGALADAGVILGYGDGTFRPGESIRRDHVAVIVARWLGVEDIAEGPFADVTPTRVRSTPCGTSGSLRGTSPATFDPRARSAGISPRR
jgi:hypothetical protein